MIINPYTFGFPPITDARVIDYMTATGIPNDGTVYFAGTYQQLTGAQIWHYVDLLFAELDAAGVYPYLIALWPQVGDTEATQKWNAIDPRDLDAAHRLTYHGTDGYVDQHGSHFLGANYINTHFAPTGIADSFFFGITQRSNKTGIAFGTVLGTGSLCWMNFAGRVVYNGWVYSEPFTTDKTQLMLTLDRPDIHNYKFLIDGVAHNKVEDIYLTPAGANDFYVGCHNDANPTPTPVAYCDGTISTFFAGNTMADSYHADFKTIMYNFNKRMKRTQRVAYFYGDSITDGSNSTTPYQTHRWTYLLSQALGLSEVNYGQGGRVLIESTPAPYPPSMYVNSTTIVPPKTVDDTYIGIAYGVNDARYLIDLSYTNYTTALFTSQLQTIIDNVLAQGWSASDIVLITGYRTSGTFTAQYANLVAATISVGGSNGCQVIDLSGLTYNPGDNIHPDNDGHIEIAAYVATQLI